MDLNQAIIQAKRGEAILFTGAGFSLGATNSREADNNKIPDARGFAAYLASQINKPAQYDLPIIAQAFVRDRGEHELLAALSSTFTVTNVEAYHRTIAALPWSRAYTTNYDNCFEYAAKLSSKTWTPLTLDDVSTALANRCVHINGHVHNLTIQSLKKQVKLTHSSYSAEAFAGSGWAQQFRQDLNVAPAVIFIGYSLSDLDIARVLFAAPELPYKTHFIVGPHDDDIVVSPLEEFGTVHRIGTSKFAEMVDAVVVPKDPSTHSYTWLKKYEPPSAETPTDKKAIDLLTLGVVDQAAMVWSMGSPETRYAVRRLEVAEVMSEITAKRQWFLLHSDLGNGKTVLKHQLSHALQTSLQYNVYWDTGFDLRRKADIRHLAQSGERCAIFIDETPERFGAVDDLLTLNLTNVVVFVCVRTTLYELGQASYDEVLPSDYIPIDLNKLEDDEIDQFRQLFDTLGLWGSRASDSSFDKNQFIKLGCFRRVSNLILALFQDSEVGQRITSAATKALADSDEITEMVVLSLLLTRIGHVPRAPLLSEILDKDVWKLMRSDAFKPASEFIRVRDGVVESQSPIIAQHLLRNAIKSERLLALIRGFVGRLDKIRSRGTYSHVFTEFCRFPFLEGIIPDGNRKRELIIGFYQDIKSLGGCAQNAQFWLHYAMARLSFGEFKESTLYFDHAKSLAASAKDLRDVNNHYARLLLDSRTKSDEYADYFEAFQKAHEILLDQMNTGNNKIYPYRQAINYVSFISARKRNLSKQQLHLFVSACDRVLAAIGHLQGEISRKREVRDCSDAMNRAKEIAMQTE